MSFTDEEFEEGDIAYELGKASDALETVYVLRELSDKKKDDNDYSVSEEKIVNLALESFHTKYEEVQRLPEYSLEAYDTGTPKSSVGEKVKKTIDYLFSIARRLIVFFIDYVRNNKHKAKRYVEKTKELIGRADSLQGSPIRIENRGLLNALHVNGEMPKDIAGLYTTLVRSCEGLRRYNGIHELTVAINQSRVGDLERTRDDAEKVRDVCEDAMKSSMDIVNNPQRSFAFDSSRVDCEYYLSKPYFGNRHIAGFISSEVKNDGSFLIECQTKRDPEQVLKVSFFETIRCNEIRDICRIIQKFCNTTISSSTDEAALSRLMREASFVAGTNADLTTVLALRSLASVGKGPYLAHMHLAMRITRTILTFCDESVSAYERQRDQRMQNERGAY